MSVTDAIRSLMLKVDRLENEKKHLRESLESKDTHVDFQLTQKDNESKIDDHQQYQPQSFTERQLRDQLRTLQSRVEVVEVEKKRLHDLNMQDKNYYEKRITDLDIENRDLHKHIQELIRK